MQGRFIYKDWTRESKDNINQQKSIKFFLIVSVSAIDFFDRGGALLSLVYLVIIVLRFKLIAVWRPTKKDVFDWGSRI